MTTLLTRKGENVEREWYRFLNGEDRNTEEALAPTRELTKIDVRTPLEMDPVNLI